MKELLHKPRIDEKLFFFLSGAVISTPFPVLINSIASYYLFSNLGFRSALILTVAIFIPLLEEFAKAYPLFYRHKETERSLATLGLLTGLGFGLTEFFLYTLTLNVPIALRLPLVFFHASLTIIVAFGIGRYRSWLYYLIAVFLHGIYNYSILTRELNIFAIITVMTAFVLAWYLYKKTREIEIF